MQINTTDKSSLKKTNTFLRFIIILSCICFIFISGSIYYISKEKSYFNRSNQLKIEIDKVKEEESTLITDNDNLKITIDDMNKEIDKLKEAIN